MKKELDFLLIDGRYGGDQNRFARFRMWRGGCSTVCACHAAACLAAKDPSRRALSPLPGLVITEAEFDTFSIDMFRFVYPRHRGMPTTALFQEAFQGYADHRGIPVSYRSLQGDAPTAEAEAFVRESIDAGDTIQYLLLLHAAREFNELGWHWFTVTGYEETPDGLHIIFSTWGQRRTLPLAALWDTRREEKGGLLVIN